MKKPMSFNTFMSLFVMVIWGLGGSRMAVVQAAWQQQRPSRNPQQAMRRAQERMEQSRAENQRRREQWRKQTEANAKQYEDYGLKQALGVTDQQWALIKPRFERVSRLASESHVGISVSHSIGMVGGGGGGGAFSSSGGGTSGGSTSTGYGMVRGGNSGGSFFPGSCGGGVGGGGSGGTLSGGQSDMQTFGDVNGPAEANQVNVSWSWMRPSSMKKGELTEGEKTCEALLDLIEKKADPQQAQQKLEEIRRIRQKALEELAQARKELREVLDTRQQIILSLMGWLD
jgi:hypothetical protein